MGYYGWSTMMDGFGAVWGILAMIIFWALIIWAFFTLIRWAGWRHHRHHFGADHEASPLDILKMRYAKGEIDKKEFDEKKKDLGNS